MINIKVHSQRFNLYYLDEGEMYIKDFSCIIQYIYPITNKIEQLKGIIHFCTRSIIFESDNEEFLITKFHFRNLKERPKIQYINEKDMFKLKINKMILIPNKNVYEPYKNFDIESDVVIDFLFEKIETIAEIIYELIDKFNSKQSLFEFDSLEYLGTLYSFQFDYTLIKTINENFLLKHEIIVKQLLPLLEIPGTLMLTNNRIYFQPVFKMNTKKCFSIKYIKIKKIFKRELCLGEKGLEIIQNEENDNYVKQKNLFLIFQYENERDNIYDLIINHTEKNIETNFSIEKYMKLWVEGNISNYDYIILLNNAANRTRNDLSQYPVFPWIFSDYKSNNLNINDKNIYRDLSKPIGALNPERLKKFIKRYEEMSNPKFLYGIHYSNPSYVISYLVRKFPEYMLKLHNGKFDNPDRLFSSIQIEWEICYNLTVKELIPEFYEKNTDFLKNEKKINFGLNSNGEKIDNVILPNWALNQNDFLEKMRNGLESEYVNENLDKWIDLIFGVNQRGENAIKNYNLFHPLCYGNDEYFNLNDKEQKKIIKIQINEFGKVPFQLFKEKHPKKFSNKIKELNPFISNDKIIENNNKNKEIEDKEKNKEIKITFNEKKQIENKILKDKEFILSDNHQEKINELKSKKTTFEIKTDLNYNLFKNKFSLLKNFHNNSILCSTILSENKLFVTGGKDGYIKIFDFFQKEIYKEFFYQNYISSITNINDKNLIALSYGSLIDIINIQLGKKISSFYGSEIFIKNLFSFDNFLINDNEVGILNVWDMNSQNKIPIESKFLFNLNKVIYSSFNKEINYYYALDNEGNISINKIMSLNEEIYNGKIKFENNNPLCIKCNNYNLNQFFIGFEKGIKIFDIRTFKCIDFLNFGKNVKNIINDNKYILYNNDEEIKIILYNTKELINISEQNIILNDFDNKVNKISNINFFYNLQNKIDMLLVPLINGDLYYSL